jgi:hypothetical protein
MWAAWHKRDPAEPLSDTARASVFPREVIHKAGALQNAIKRHRPPALTLATLGGWRAADYWWSLFDQRTWSDFSAVLTALANAARPNSRPRDQRLRSLERKVLSVLDANNLLARTNPDAADLLAEIKAHALDWPVPRTQAARVKALRDAVKRCQQPRSWREFTELVPGSQR